MHHEENELEKQLFSGVTDSEDCNNATGVVEDSGMKPAWNDDDDKAEQIELATNSRRRKLRKREDDDIVAGNEYQKRLKEQYVSKHSVVEWANLAEPKADDDNPSDIDSDEEAILRTTEKTLDLSIGALPEGILEVQRAKDANQQSPSKAVVQSVEFHSNGQLLLTAGYDKTLRLFQIDGKTNAKVQSVFIPDLPIGCAAFTNDRIIMSGPRPFFYSYDLNSGRIEKIPKLLGRKEKKLDKFSMSQDGKWMVFIGSDGYLPIVSAASNQWVANLKMNGEVNSAAFASDPNYLYTCGSDGLVYHWDMRMRRCIDQHTDEGSLNSTVLATASNGMHAVGSTSGVVNLYGTGNGERKPLKSFMHLTTNVDTMCFNSDSQILAMSSRDSKDSLKMVHVPSRTVFSNWPTAKTPVHYATSMAFSPNSGYFALGNDRGRVLLYRLQHYTRT